MTQTLTLTPSSDPLGLSPWPSGGPMVITGTVPASPSMSTWRMQLWKRPHDARVTDAEPLATAVGTVASSTLTIAFSPSQMDYDALSLSDAVGANNYFLTVGGTDTDGAQQIVRFGNIEIIPVPFDASAATTATAITVEDDIATFTFNGATYRIPVEEIASPPGAVEGEIVVLNDMAVLTIDGTSYTFPVEET